MADHKISLMLQRFEGVGAGSSGAVDDLAIFSAVSMAETTSLVNAHVRDLRDLSSRTASLSVRSGVHAEVLGHQQGTVGSV